MLLKSSQQRLQHCFRPHFNRRFSQEVMGFQSGGSPNFGNFRTFELRVPKQNDIWVQPLWLDTKNTIRGRVLAFPKFGPW
jgi:predicted secreted protein